MARPGLVVPGRKHQNRATNGIPFLALSLFSALAKDCMQQLASAS